MELRGFNYAEANGVRRPVYRDIRPRSADYSVMLASVALLSLSGAVAIQTGTFPVIPTPWLVFLGVLVCLLGVVSWRISRTINRSGTTSLSIALRPNMLGGDSGPVL